MTQYGSNETEYFESEKYYTMGPGIDFPMIMSYKDTENPNFKAYYYFLNGHNDVVYFADANFTEEQIESYEYNPWGLVKEIPIKNSILFKQMEFDFESGYYFANWAYYIAHLGITIRESEKIMYNPTYYSFIRNLFDLYDNLLPLRARMPRGDSCVSCRVSITCRSGGRISGSCRAHGACCCTCGDTGTCIIVRKDCPDLSVYVDRCCRPT